MYIFEEYVCFYVFAFKDIEVMLFVSKSVSVQVHVHLNCRVFIQILWHIGATAMGTNAIEPCCLKSFFSLNCKFSKFLDTQKL